MKLFVPEVIAFTGVVAGLEAPVDDSVDETTSDVVLAAKQQVIIEKCTKHCICLYDCSRSRLLQSNYNDDRRMTSRNGVDTILPACESVQYVRSLLAERVWNCEKSGSCVHTK